MYNLHRTDLLTAVFSHIKTYHFALDPSLSLNQNNVSDLLHNVFIKKALEYTKSLQF